MCVVCSAAVDFTICSFYSAGQWLRLSASPNLRIWQMFDEAAVKHLVKHVSLVKQLVQGAADRVGDRWCACQFVKGTSVCCKGCGAACRFWLWYTAGAGVLDPAYAVAVLQFETVLLLYVRSC
jgi:hypothetical protein